MAAKFKRYITSEPERRWQFLAYNSFSGIQPGVIVDERRLSRSSKIQWLDYANVKSKGIKGNGIIQTRQLCIDYYTMYKLLQMFPSFFRLLWCPFREER